MSTQVPTSDSELLDLLRIARTLSVSELSDAMEVTPTAVRQRLVRLLAQHAIQREAMRHGRGRPKHRYSLTADGLSRTGSNLTDLPVTLSQEIGQSNDPEVRRETLRQIARTLATSYTSPIRDAKPTERNERRIPAAILEG